jgi:hypothetical protein
VSAPAGRTPGDAAGGDRKALQLVVVSAGASDPSSTSMLADRLAAGTVRAGERRGRAVAVTTIELRPLANEIAAALVSQINGPGLKPRSRLSPRPTASSRRPRSTRRASAASSSPSSTSSTTTS